MLKRWVITGAMIGLVACSNAKPPMLPVWRGELGTQGLEGAPELFKQGWQDGCETGSATSATQFQRLFYGFKINEQLVRNDEYYNAWNKGFRYCHRYLFQYHRKAFSN